MVRDGASRGGGFSRGVSFVGQFGLVDQNGGGYNASSTAPLQPMSTLHYMCTPGHNNTFSTYTYAGGRVWLAGGAAAFASLREFNATGADNNDHDYGFNITAIYAGPGYAHHQGKEELQAGRLMYDGAKWQSMMAYQAVSAGIVRSRHVLDYLDRKWVDQPGFGFANPVHRPDYNLLPDRYHNPTNPATDPVNGEPIPPTRPASYSGAWWTTSPLRAIEYLLQPNIVIEDMNPEPVAESLEVALDSLMSVSSSNVADTGFEPVCMTWYHGVSSPEFVFSGFPIWAARRSDVQLMVDFVMQQIWHLPKATLPAAAARQGASPYRQGAPAVSPASARAHLPFWRSGGK